MKKTIPINEWQERLQLFSMENRGRHSAIVTYNKTIVEDKKFRDIEYDLAGNGDDMVITLEGPDDTFRHIIQDPAVLFIKYRPDGVVSILEIINQNRESAYLMLYGKN